MNFKVRKYCDRCKARKSIKRYSLMRHYNYDYGYLGFDICEDCEKELHKFFEEFIKEHLERLEMI